MLNIKIIDVPDVMNKNATFENVINNVTSSFTMNEYIVKSSSEV